MSKMDSMHATRPFDCHWCDRPIAVDQAVVTDGLGRPLHVGGCAELSAEHDKEGGVTIGDDRWYICNDAMAWLWNRGRVATAPGA